MCVEYLYSFLHFILFFCFKSFGVTLRHIFCIFPFTQFEKFCFLVKVFNLRLFLFVYEIWYFIYLILPCCSFGTFSIWTLFSLKSLSPSNLEVRNPIFHSTRSYIYSVSRVKQVSTKTLHI